MTVTRAAGLYVALMLAAGVAVGFLIVQQPHLRSAAVPPMMWLLGVSLVFDVVVMQLAARGIGEPLTMPARLIGMVGAALAFLLVADVIMVRG